MKIYMVARGGPGTTKNPKLKHQVFGFVSVFGWENPMNKAEKKYPGHGITLVQEYRFPWKRK